MNRTNLDWFGAASSTDRTLRLGLASTCRVYISNRSQAAATRFRFTRMNFYGLGQVRAERGIDPIESGD